MLNLNEVLLAPAHQFNGRDVITKVCKLVQADRGYRMTLERLSRLTGLKTSTAGYSFGVGSQRQVLAFVSLFERLSESSKRRLTAELFRVMPTVFHDSLAHDARVVSQLLEILKKPRGLTMIYGGTTAARSFLVNALGHTFTQVDRRHRAVGGLDAHEPSKLVPCEDMLYLCNRIDRERSRQLMLEVWPKIRSSDAPFLLFNDVWSLVPEIHEELMKFAEKRHVVVSNWAPLDRCRALRKKGIPVHVLSISVSKDQPEFIGVSCQSPRSRRKKTVMK